VERGISGNYHLYHCNRDWRNGWWRWVMEVEMVVVMEVEMVVEMAVEIDS